MVLDFTTEEDLNKIQGIEAPMIEQKESIKITKNAKGNYQYEVKILSLDVEKLKEITDKIEEKYNIKDNV